MDDDEEVQVEEVEVQAKEVQAKDVQVQEEEVQAGRKFDLPGFKPENAAKALKFVLLGMTVVKGVAALIGHRKGTRQRPRKAKKKQVVTPPLTPPMASPAKVTKKKTAPGSEVSVSAAQDIVASFSRAFYGRSLSPVETCDGKT
eukprot:346473-Prorocentrum_minimum.AAC.3